LAVGIGACVGGRVMPGGSVVFVALIALLLEEISMWMSERDVSV
jgi:hypothetical protein